MGQKLGLENVLVVPGLEGVGLALLLPVPDEDLQVVGPRREQTSGVVEVDRVDAALVALQLVAELEPLNQGQLGRRLADERRCSSALLTEIGSKLAEI